MTSGLKTNSENFECRSKRKIEALGFKFSQLETLENPWDYGLILRGLVHCPCGKVEKFCGRGFKKETDLDWEIVFETLYKNNFNEKHLRDDGFPEDFIQQCKLKYTEIEELTE